MAKHWGVTSFMALALLACLVGTEIEAQGQGVLNLPAKADQLLTAVQDVHRRYRRGHGGHGGHGGSGGYYGHGGHAGHGGHGGRYGHGGHAGHGGSGGYYGHGGRGGHGGHGGRYGHGGHAGHGGSGGYYGHGGHGGSGGHGGYYGHGGHAGHGGNAGGYVFDHSLGNPKLAIDTQQRQNPKIPQTPYISQPILSKHPPADSCEVTTNRIQCGLDNISPDGCKDINCCFDGQQCYYGKSVTVQCTKDGQFIVVVARDATLPNIDLESISLLSKDQGCTHVDSNSDFAIYNFPVTSCGTLVLEEPGVIIYENKMFSSYEVETGRHGVITRDSHYELLFQCRYIGTTVQTVVVEVLALEVPPLLVAALGPIRVELRLGNGQCFAKGCNEVDAAYTSSYTEADYPVTKVLRDPVYVEVQLMEKTDPNLVLTLGRCWATTSPNPHSLPQWDILKDGCPCKNDNYLSSLVPVGPSSGLDLPSHYRRFLFKMFTFVDPNSMKPMREQVYIHCSTAVCIPAAGYSCEPTCYRKRRDVMAVDQTHSESKVVVSVGPVSMVASAE